MVTYMANLTRAFAVVSCLFLMCVYAPVHADEQSAISLQDLTVIKQYLTQIKGQIADMQAAQSKMEQEIEAVRIRIRKSGKGL